MTFAPPLVGLRVLLLEDEMLVSLSLEALLADEGCTVVGPFDRVDTALVAARRDPIDLAILDVNVAGVMAFPVGDALDQRGIPFLFVSGYGQSFVSAYNPNWRVCPKPFRPERLVAMLKEQLTGAGRH